MSVRIAKRNFRGCAGFVARSPVWLVVARTIGENSTLAFGSSCSRPEKNCTRFEEFLQRFEEFDRNYERQSLKIARKSSSNLMQHFMAEKRMKQLRHLCSGQARRDR